MFNNNDNFEAVMRNNYLGYLQNCNIVLKSLSSTADKYAAFIYFLYLWLKEIIYFCLRLVKTELYSFHLNSQMPWFPFTDDFVVCGFLY